LSYKELNTSLRSFYLTEYTSSLTIIKMLNPSDIIFVNLPPNSRLFNQYQADITPQISRKKINVYDSDAKKLRYLSYSN
jgi:hypothetical protein